MRIARNRFALTLITLVALTLSWIAAVHVLPIGATRHTPVTQVPARAQLLTAEQAVALARATKKTVVATALTTPDSLTTASPDGLLTLTQTLGPTRVWKPGPGGTGQWVPLNATLVRAGSRLATTATSQSLSLSAGGAGPLAVLSDAGRTLAVNWPSTLPAPVVSGATATYRSVLPGVDLVVTADTMGGITTTLIIHNATAAKNPALRSLQVSLSPSPGLRVTADAAGNLAVGAGGNAQPAFTADAARMWDSAPPSASTPLVTGSDGAAHDAQSGLLAYSSATAPGIGAHTTSVPLSVSGDTITLAPLAAALTGPTVIYPVNVDMTNFSSPLGNDASNWAQVDDQHASESFWEPKSDLQVGYCYPFDASCGSLHVERSFFTVPISSSLRGSNVVIFYSHILMNDEWVANCNKADDQVNLFATPSIDSNHKPTWDSTNHQTTWWNNEVDHQAIADQNPKLGGNGGCPWAGTGVPDVTWNVTGTIKDDLKDTPIVSSQTFGMRADNENPNGVDTNWHQFVWGAENITISTSYNLNPNKPTRLGATGGTVPAIACGTSTSPVQIGHDDVTLSAYEEDDDGDAMTTVVSVWDPADTKKTPLLGSPFTLSPNDHSSTLVVLPTPISRDTLTKLHPSAFTYEWSATTADQYLLSGTQAETSDPCFFNYDPNGPGQPNIQSWAYPAGTPACPGSVACPIQIPPGQPNLPPPVAIGQSLTVFVGPPNGCGPTATPCPTSYTYQLGAGQPATVTVNSSPSCTPSTCPCMPNVCAMTFTMNQYGPVTLTIAGMANGNPGTAITPGLQGTAPVPPYLDGYFSGGANPDLLAVGSGNQPSLWLYPSTGPGSLGYGIDIGSEGTGINPGTDGPADWANVKTTNGTTVTIGPAQVAHGDFEAQDGVQDVIAYYPPVGSTYGDHAGVGELIPGPGIDATLQAHSANVTEINPLNWTDPKFNVSSALTPLPISLVGAGNASETGATGGDDLVGVYGDPNDGYELAMWTAGPQSGGYGDALHGYGLGTMTELSPQGTPDGSTWDKFSLATAQPTGIETVNGKPVPFSIAGATVLFALDNSNGQVYVSFNAGCPPTNPTATCSTATTDLIGASWHLLTGPKLTNTSLASADVISGGTTELWTVSNGTATAYTVTYPSASNNNMGSITQEAATVPLTSPVASWPLTDGATAGNCPSTTPATATDDIQGLIADLSSGASWDSDGTFGCVLELDGSTGQAQMESSSLYPNGALLNTTESYSVAAWVKLTNTANISVVASQDGKNTSGFRLQFQNRSNTWQFIVANTDSQTPSLSYAIGTNAGTAPTLDAWTFLVGVYDAASKTATLYVNGIPAGSTGVSSTINATGSFYMGHGMYNSTQNYYWPGDLSQVQAWTSALTQAQIQVLYQHAR